MCGRPGGRKWRRSPSTRCCTASSSGRAGVIAPLCGALHAVAGVPPAGAAGRAAAVAAIRSQYRLAADAGRGPSPGRHDQRRRGVHTGQGHSGRQYRHGQRGVSCREWGGHAGVACGSTQTLTAVHDTAYGPSGLPVISSPITIEGNGSTILRDEDAPAFRIMTVNFVGELTLQETTVSGGVASGDAFSAADGGGVFNYGTLTLTRSTISGNSACRRRRRVQQAAPSP